MTTKFEKDINGLYPDEIVCNVYNVSFAVMRDTEDGGGVRFGSTRWTTDASLATNYGYVLMKRACADEVDDDVSRVVIMSVTHLGTVLVNTTARTEVRVIREAHESAISFTSLN